MQTMFIAAELLARIVPVIAVTLSLIVQVENRKLLALLIGQYAAWLFACVGLGLYFLPHNNESPQIFYGALRFDFASVVMAVSITTIAAMVLTFAERNFLGNTYRVPLIRNLAILAALAAFIVPANTMLLFWLCWFGISILLRAIIAQKKEFRSSAQHVFNVHCFSDICLLVAFSLLAWHTGQFSFYVHPAQNAGGISVLPSHLATLIALLIVVAMVSKSALFPFDSWLVATIDAPTPPSALLHAGVVNVSAILAIRCYADIVVSPFAHDLWVIWAAVAAVAGTLQSSVRSDIKNDLVASTSGQMAWMQLQLSQGNFAAAILHLIAHGFYKALLFLTAHSSIDMGVQKEMYGHEDETHLRWSRLVLPAVLIITVGFWLIRAGSVHSEALLAVLIAASGQAAVIPSFNRIGRGYLFLAALTFGVVVMASGFAGEFFSSHLVSGVGKTNSFQTAAIIACVVLALGLNLVKKTVVGKALYMAAINGFYVGEFALLLRLGVRKLLLNEGN